MTHADLIPVAYKWAIKTGKCGVAFKEFKTLCPNSEIPDVLGFKENFEDNQINVNKLGS